ncbi:extracellular solute-binding protein [Paenibacillus sp. GCM10023248]|uniref:extracellular solute-binding protein n=1 Tax=Bacillales TaxID=1385 RepID=UPI002377E7E6|nr:MULTISPECIES: extracellular solute-binding protein [Bacillales]MDD9268971.1 extracellular solute-binding protein [Paenibacillus sp. MAHUQ-63]MDR6885028.1 raffinose/stachyose/melibiose transport system substrate-binding protein [Bacillus sp. 3255]
MIQGLIRKSVVVAASAALLTLTACGNGTEPAAQDAGGAKASNSPAAKEQVTLSFEENWSTPNVDNQLYKERIQKFQQLNPEIKIEMQDIPSAQYRTKLRTEAAGNSMPDMFILYPGVDMDPYIDANVLMPLDEIMDTWKDILPPQALAGYNVGGKQYAIPTKMTFVDIIYYHKDMLAKVGYNEFPKTYTEFLDLVKKLKASGITPLGIGNKNRWPLQSSVMSAVEDRVAGTDFLTKVKQGQAKFTDADYVKALGIFDELTKLDAFNADLNTMDEVQVQDYFLQKKAAMTITSSTIDTKFRVSNAESGDNIGIALFPSVEGGKGTAGKSAGVIQYGIGLSKELKGAKKDAAIKFLKYFYAPELYQSLMSKGIVVPAKVDMPADTSKYLKEMLQLTKSGDALVFDSVMPASVKDAIENGLQAITMKQKTPEQIAKEMQDAMDKVKK